MRGVCIVCGHKLSSHVDEGEYWRCHSIATPDLLQCECCLRKDRAGGDITFYDWKKRVEERRKEMPDIFKILGEVEK